MTGPIWRRTWVWAWLVVICLMMVTIDGPISSWAGSIERKYWDIFRILANPGDAKYWLIPLAGLGGLLFLCYLVDPNTQRARLVGWMAGWCGFAFAAIAYSGILVTLIKILVGRARPNVLDTLNWPVLHPFSFKYAYHSFPSGHANTLFVVAMVVGFLAPRVRTPLFILAGALAFCRVLQHRHFISDSVGGALLAVVTTLWLRHVFANKGLLFRYRRDGAIGLTAPGRLLTEYARRLSPRRLVSAMRRHVAGGAITTDGKSSNGNAYRR